MYAVTRQWLLEILVNFHLCMSVYVVNFSLHLSM